MKGDSNAPLARSLTDGKKDSYSRVVHFWQGEKGEWEGRANERRHVGDIITRNQIA